MCASELFEEPGLVFTLWWFWLGTRPAHRSSFSVHALLRLRSVCWYHLYYVFMFHGPWRTQLQLFMWEIIHESESVMARNIKLGQEMLFTQPASVFQMRLVEECGLYLIKPDSRILVQYYDFTASVFYVSGNHSCVFGTSNFVITSQWTSALQENLLKPVSCLQLGVMVDVLNFCLWQINPMWGQQSKQKVPQSPTPEIHNVPNNLCSVRWFLQPVSSFCPATWNIFAL